MKQKFERWCYGGQSKAFFIEQSEIIHQYNTRMMDRLLLIMTIIIGAYLVASTANSGIFHQYLIAYVLCFAVLLTMFCIFQLKKSKSNLFTKAFIFIFSLVMFAFVCILGTVYTPESRASLFIVYVLALPMLFVIPTHYMYAFLTIGCGIFSFMSLQIKAAEYSHMDVSHGMTCLVLGAFVSHHILESRIALYALNKQLDTHNIELDKRVQAQEIELLQGRISIMLTQIQPHFLYNALTAICGLCDVDPKEAKKVTAKFSDYLRHNLESLNHSEPICFEKELRHTQAYLEIEQQRFLGKLNIVCDIGVDDFYLPALTVQPIAENAVKHGVMKRKTGGTITISTKELADCYEITVADDGVGFDPTVPQAEPEAHIGITNVRNRLQSMCDGTLTVASEKNIGTVVTIKIPKGGKSK